MPERDSSGGSPSSRVYERLSAAVLGGDYEPEQALKPQQLADELGVSLAVVREALLRMVGEGLAVRLPNRGFATPAAGARRWQEIAEARALVEPAMLRLAIERGDLEWEAGVRAAHHRLAGTPPHEERDGRVRISPAWVEAHHRFHRALLEACDNQVLLDTFDRLHTASELGRRWAAASTPRRDADSEHEALERLTLQRRPDEAARALATHLAATAAALEDPAS